MNKQQMATAVGGLSHTSKMPGKSWGLSPANTCKIGGMLRMVAGSVCNSCYARKGQYMLSNVINAHANRLRATHSLLWEGHMVELIKGVGHFRWHDSGDLYSYEYLCKVMRIIRATPEVKHWIPTHERALVNRWMRAHGQLPTNVVVRLSGAMIDGEPISGSINTSTVHTVKGEGKGRECTSYKRGGACGTCRLCWNKAVKNISYLKH